MIHGLVFGTFHLLLLNAWADPGDQGTERAQEEAGKISRCVEALETYRRFYPEFSAALQVDPTAWSKGCRQGLSPEVLWGRAVETHRSSLARELLEAVGDGEKLDLGALTQSQRLKLQEFLRVPPTHLSEESQGLQRTLKASVDGTQGRPAIATGGVQEGVQKVERLLEASSAVSFDGLVKKREVPPGESLGAVSPQAFQALDPRVLGNHERWLRSQVLPIHRDLELGRLAPTARQFFFDESLRGLRDFERDFKIKHGRLPKPEELRKEVGRLAFEAEERAFGSEGSLLNRYLHQTEKGVFRKEQQNMEGWALAGFSSVPGPTGAAATVETFRREPPETTLGWALATGDVGLSFVGGGLWQGAKQSVKWGARGLRQVPALFPKLLDHSADLARKTQDLVSGFRTSR